MENNKKSSKKAGCIATIVTLVVAWGAGIAMIATGDPALAWPGTITIICGSYGSLIWLM